MRGIAFVMFLVPFYLQTLQTGPLGLIPIAGCLLLAWRIIGSGYISTHATNAWEETLTTTREPTQQEQNELVLACKSLKLDPSVAEKIRINREGSYGYASCQFLREDVYIIAVEEPLVSPDRIDLLKAIIGHEYGHTEKPARTPWPSLPFFFLPVTFVCLARSTALGTISAIWILLCLLVISRYEERVRQNIEYRCDARAAMLAGKEAVINLLEYISTVSSPPQAIKGAHIVKEGGRDEQQYTWGYIGGYLMMLVCITIFAKECPSVLVLFGETTGWWNRAVDMQTHPSPERRIARLRQYGTPSS